MVVMVLRLRRRSRRGRAHVPPDDARRRRQRRRHAAVELSPLLDLGAELGRRPVLHAQGIHYYNIMHLDLNLGLKFHYGSSEMSQTSEVAIQWYPRGVKYGEV